MSENKIQLFIYILIGTVLTIIISNNIKSILNYRKGLDRIEETNSRLVEAETANTELKAKIEETQNPEYQKKLAIEELNLVSEDATILVIPEENSLTNTTVDETHSLTEGVTVFSNWLKYLKLK